MSVRVVTIEDDSRYRASLEALFDLTPDCTLAASFPSATAAVEHLDSCLDRGARPLWDVVLMDVQLPGMNGIEATRRIKAVMPEVAVVVLTVFDEPTTVVSAICAGAEGYVLKRTPPDELLDNVRAVMAGGSPLTPAIARTVLGLVRRDPSGAERPPDRVNDGDLVLTDREQDVLRCLVEGMAYKTTARRLGISIDTVRSHVRNVYRKLQVHSVAEAVSRAIREGLV